MPSRLLMASMLFVSKPAHLLRPKRMHLSLASLMSVKRVLCASSSVSGCPDGRIKHMHVYPSVVYHLTGVGAGDGAGVGCRVDKPPNVGVVRSTVVEGVGTVGAAVVVVVVVGAAVLVVGAVGIGAGAPGAAAAALASAYSGGVGATVGGWFWTSHAV